MKKKKHRCRRYSTLRFTPGEIKLSIIAAAAFLIIALIIRLFVGSPYRTISYCNLDGIFPSMFVLALCWILWYILLGAAFGSVFGLRLCSDEVSKYKGGMLFVLMMTLCYLWYPVFFGAMALFVALLICEAVLVLSLLVALLFMRVRRFAGLVMFAFCGWMIYMVILNIMSLFAV